MEKCHKIKITSGSLEGQTGFQITNEAGDLVGLFDADGDSLNQGNATWELTSGEIEAPWA